MANLERAFLTGLGALSLLREEVAGLASRDKPERDAAMTSRERTLAAISHRQVDRVPVMVWSEPHTALKMTKEIRPPKKALDNLPWKAADLLAKYLPTEEARNFAPLPLYLVQPDYLRELGSDAIDVFWGNPLNHLGGIWLEDGHIRIKDNWGVVHGMCGLYAETVDVPCPTKEDLDDYQFPDASPSSNYNNIRFFRKRYPQTAIAGWTLGVQDCSQHWHGMERLYTGMLCYPRTIKKFFQKMREQSIQIIKGSLEAGADIIIIGDDYGSQNSLLISKEMWEEFTYPHLKKQVESVHEYGGKALLHSDGYIMPLLPKFVEAEVDALHPLQPGTGNDLKEAKQKYGKRLTFFTGIDVQKMPLMTKKEVREDIVNAYKTGSKKGGFILCTTHALQVNTPTQNLKEMFATIKDIKRGRYG